MVVRLKIYEDDNGVHIGDLSTRGDEEAVHEEKRVLSGLLDVSQAAGEGILGTVYTRSNAPAEIGHERFGEPWGRSIYGSEVVGRIDFHHLQARPSGPCLDVELSDGAPAEVGEFFGRMLQDVVRQEHWAHASVMLNAPGQQQSLRQQLQAAGYWHYMCDPVPGDNRVLLLPCAAPVRGLERYWVPFTPQLSATPCLTRECNVKLVTGIGGFMELHFTPPLVYNYDATHQPGTPEWQREVLQLATHGVGSDCRLQLRMHQRHAPFQDGTLRLGPYLLVHGAAVDRDLEVEYALEGALEALEVLEALEALADGEAVQPEMMMIEGVLIDDPVDYSRVRGEIARAAVSSRMGTMYRMERAFKLKAAARRIGGAFKRWKWRKEVAWNPHTALGRRLLQLRAEAGAAE